MNWTTLAVCAITAPVLATVWGVPEDFPTIQLALDGLSDGDTVFVNAGVYVESLQAPDLSFMLKGDFNPGGEPELPIVDPSNLNGSSHLACLTLPANSTVEIENLVFRNGSQMFPREGNEPVGGVRNHAQALTLRHCRFDSTYWAVYFSPGALTIEHCEFADVVGYCVRDFLPGTTVIRHSTFSATGLLLEVWEGTTIENCVFSQPSNGGEWLNLYGNGITVTQCSFGPTSITCPSVIWTANSSGCTFTNNVFHNLHTTGAAIAFHGIAGDTSRLSGNLFKQIYAHTEGAGAVILQGPAVVASDNDFDSCYAFGPTGFAAVYLDHTDAVVHHNYFVGPNITYPHINTQISPNAVIHSCSFVHTGWALNSGTQLSAESNWWSDSTGPYHAEINPAGMGDWITGPVDFIPWLLENPFPDSSDAAPDPVAPLPLSTSLEVYPNPFNAVTSLQLAVSQPGAYCLDLFNTLGQRVKEIWRGHVSGTIAIALDARDLSSGIYFVRVGKLDSSQNVLLRKVVLLR